MNLLPPTKLNPNNTLGKMPVYQQTEADRRHIKYCCLMLHKLLGTTPRLSRVITAVFPFLLTAAFDLLKYSQLHVTSLSRRHARYLTAKCRIGAA